MRRRGPATKSFLMVLAVLLVSMAGLAQAGPVNHVVISQVYGGGGNAGATLTNDYIELFNPTAAPISLVGWSLQYASATGTGNLGLNAGQLTPLSGSIGAGQYLLIQENQGAGGSTPLPTPDITDATDINMSAIGAKVALVSISGSLGCNGGSTPCSAAELALIIDLVGWGGTGASGANFFEGAGAGPATSNTTALFRADGGCTDTDNNSADVATGAPNPHNSASPLHSCAGSSAVPAPASVLLLGSGLVGVATSAAWSVRRRRSPRS
jgi:uncharacterized protein